MEVNEWCLEQLIQAKIGCKLPWYYWDLNFNGKSFAREVARFDLGKRLRDFFINLIALILA